MKVISTALHARIDYLASVFFIASPWIFNFVTSAGATWTVTAVGIIALLISVFTDYEGGIIRRISMRPHLTFDVFSGAFLASSPWIFGFGQEVFLPHLVMGLFEAAVSLLTIKHTSRQRTHPFMEP